MRIVNEEGYSISREEKRTDQSRQMPKGRCLDRLRANLRETGLSGE